MSCIRVDVFSICEMYVDCVGFMVKIFLLKIGWICSKSVGLLVDCELGR